MSTSNVPAITIDSTGVTIPETSEILSGALADINAAFGGNLNIENAATPQGVLGTCISENIAAVYAKMAYIVSMFDPATAEGRYQDALARLYFLTRKSATATVVSATCTGSPGETLPSGSLAQDDAGYIYESESDAIYDSDGEATVSFQCQTAGAITCGIGTLTKIYQTVSGWDAITNETAGVVGTDAETRDEFETRRANSVAANANGSTAAIFGAVSSVDDVTDCYVYENDTSSSITVGSTSYSMVPHSVYVAAVGGTDSAVAAAIWSKKGTGCDYNGNTSATVYDSSGYSEPYPAYTVKFMRPASLACKVAVTLTDSSRLPSDIVSKTKTAVLAAFNGTDGGTKARIAKDIYASRFYAGVSSISTAVQVISILVGMTSAIDQTISVGIDQVPTLDESDITVTLA